MSVDTVRPVLEPELHGGLVLDLARLEFIDDSGLGLLLWTFKRVRERSGSLVLRHPQGQILRVLELTGIERVPGLRIELDPALPDMR